MACRLRPALQSEAPERGAEAAGLLLSLAERLLNAFAAAVPATDPTEPAAVEQLVQDYAAARSDILQDALNRAIAFCTHGATLIALNVIVYMMGTAPCGRHLHSLCNAMSLQWRGRHGKGPVLS